MSISGLQGRHQSGYHTDHGKRCRDTVVRRRTREWRRLRQLGWRGGVAGPGAAGCRARGLGQVRILALAVLARVRAVLARVVRVCDGHDVGADQAGGVAAVDHNRAIAQKGADALLGRRIEVVIGSVEGDGLCKQLAS